MEELPCARFGMQPTLIHRTSIKVLTMKGTLEETCEARSDYQFH
jgi:hypothetical protein